jgi:hypothetical protein
VKGRTSQLSSATPARILRLSGGPVWGEGLFKHTRTIPKWMPVMVLEVVSGAEGMLRPELLYVKRNSYDLKKAG